MSTTDKNIEGAKAGGKKPALVTGIVIAVLLVAVAATVTHNPVHAPEVQLVVTQGDLISPPPQVASPPAKAGLIPMTPVPAPQVLKMPPPAVVAGYAQVGFDRLAAFPVRTKWEMTDPIRIKGEQRIVGEIPEAIKTLNQSKVAVQGFMLPLKMTDGLVSDFFLLRTQAKCCYGLPIQVNEVLSVHMTGTGVKSQMDQPITVFGTFHLAETRDPSTGTLDAIYSLDAEKTVTSAL